MTIDWWHCTSKSIAEVSHWQQICAYTIYSCSTVCSKQCCTMYIDGRYGSGNSTTTVGEVFKFKCLFSNPNSLLWKTIQPPKTSSNVQGWFTGWLRFFPLSGWVESCNVSPEVWLSVLGQTSDPSFSLAWKKAILSKCPSASDLNCFRETHFNGLQVKWSPF